MVPPETESGELIGAVKGLVLLAQVHGEELGKLDGQAVQHLLQAGNRGADAVLLDQRDGGVGHAGTLRQLPLAKTVERAQSLEPGAHVEAHPLSSRRRPLSDEGRRVLRMLNMGIGDRSPFFAKCKHHGAASEALLSSFLIADQKVIR